VSLPMKDETTGEDDLAPSIRVRHSIHPYICTRIGVHQILWWFTQQRLLALHERHGRVSMVIDDLHIQYRVSQALASRHVF
jgi:hypothetical protein